MSLSVSTGGGGTSLANIPPSPYPSLPPSRQETPPKVSPIGGLLGRVRQRRSSFLLGVAGGRASAGAWACGDVKKEGVEARTVEAASSGVESQQLTHPSTASSPPGNSQEVTGSSSSTVTHVPSQPAPTEAPPTVTSSMPILQEASGSMTIEGRRMSLRKRKREETHCPTSEESEHGASNGAIVPGMKGSPSLETSLQEAGMYSNIFSHQVPFGLPNIDHLLLC
ncbi:uncharacterized protein EI90DRAFT_3051992, partial [Cantharellus anzutake]|uniref:uncharacterized protein n=1 Tax=Cantharellus anzutake TaxID=1750568 RepID=UPI001908EB45